MRRRVQKPGWGVGSLQDRGRGQAAVSYVRGVLGCRVGDNKAVAAAKSTSVPSQACPATGRAPLVGVPKRPSATSTRRGDRPQRGAWQQQEGHPRARLEQVREPSRGPAPAATALPKGDPAPLPTPASPGRTPNRCITGNPGLPRWLAAAELHSGRARSGAPTSGFSPPPPGPPSSRASLPEPRRRLRSRLTRQPGAQPRSRPQRLGARPAPATAHVCALGPAHAPSLLHAPLGTTLATP